MGITTVACAHESTYFDVDEWRCRTCGASLTYPARAPGPEDVKDRQRDSRITAGEAHRVHRPAEVVEAVQEQVQEDVEVDPPAPSLLCHCCKAMLPPESFYVSNRQGSKSRGFRAPRCRGCTAFQLRVMRQQDPEGIRERDRARRERYIQALTPEQKEGEKQRRRKNQKTGANAAAQVRSRTRQDGRGVPLQRPGRLSLHIKPICRIAEMCPLREFCTTSAKGLA